MWKQLEKSLEPDAKGFRKVRHIGISNFNVTQLEDLMASAKVKPYTHQIEAHPYLQDWAFYSVHQKLGVPMSAYAPLGNTNPEYHYRNWKSAGRLMLDDPVLKSIAKARGCSPAQVALKWNLERKVPVIVKSTSHAHQLENYEANANCKLTPEDLAKIKALDKNGAGGRRYWDMCCAMHAPCFLGLQDAAAHAPVAADYCTDPWKAGSMAYNPQRTDLWLPVKGSCEREL
jgi:diketogulonate reductase-like aldo/keto reductase